MTRHPRAELSRGAEDFPVTGPQEQRLDHALAGIVERDIAAAGVEWLEARDLLMRVAATIATSAPEAREALRGRTGEAVDVALQRTLEAMREEADALARGGQALLAAAEAAATARRKRVEDQLVLADPAADGHRRERVARRWADYLDLVFEESAAVMQQIHGRPGPPGTPARARPWGPASTVDPRDVPAPGARPGASPGPPPVDGPELRPGTSPGLVPGLFPGLAAGLGSGWASGPAALVEPDLSLTPSLAANPAPAGPAPVGPQPLVAHPLDQPGAGTSAGVLAGVLGGGLGAIAMVGRAVAPAPVASSPRGGPGGAPTAGVLGGGSTARPHPGIGVAAGVPTSTGRGRRRQRRADRRDEAVGRPEERLEDTDERTPTRSLRVSTRRPGAPPAGSGS